MNKEAKVKAAIEAKTDSFSYWDIANECDCSPGYAMCVINRYISQQKVTASKNGRKTTYAFTSNSSISQDKSDVQHTNNICSIEDLFLGIESLTRMVATGKSPSVLITGLSGIGKTFIVSKVLEETKTEHIVIKGHSSPLGLYEALYENNGNVIVFDDCDSIFDNEICTNILKGALDSYATRRISWLGRGIGEKSETPSSFEFTGRIIFISNLDQSKIDEAVKSRTLCVNITMSRREVTERLELLLPVLEPGVSKEIKQEVLDYIHEFRDSFPQYNIRTLIKAIRIRVCNKDTWKTLVRITN
jgi:hypothetical protein